MTTTAVRRPVVVLNRDQDVMDERFAIGPRGPNLQPSQQAAARVGIMRRIAAAQLRFHGLDVLIDAVQLVVSELVTNAVRHSGAAEGRVILTTREGCLHIVVVDGVPGEASLKPAGATAESGRGLHLVDAIAMEHGGAWGTRAAGAETWCRLEVPTMEGQS
ncbi:ATP-binding protein [Streptomyces sp. GbtcB6]|uniref:ATP-binding protein n=1 Tax=Streptomyces sp. GbtcB6 TaxID=2824751 RepID=UPI001C302397|nr:ATP-binding protein [Streptomyces sp. GbtcB6]